MRGKNCKILNMARESEQPSENWSYEVDEGRDDVGNPALCFESVDPEGYIRLTINIPLHSTPQDIAALLEGFATEMVLDDSHNLTAEYILDKIKFFKQHARNVPGLKR